MKLGIELNFDRIIFFFKIYIIIYSHLLCGISVPSVILVIREVCVPQPSDARLPGHLVGPSPGPGSVLSTGGGGGGGGGC